jgi:heat shock protein HtpX
MAKQRTSYGRDTGLNTRMAITMFLLGLLYVVFIGVLIAVGVSYLFVIVIAGGLLLAQYFFSDKMALAAMGAKVTKPEEAPELHAMIERLCLTADLPKPKVAVAPHQVPNAFAAGRSPKHATVCATTGIMETLSPTELEGVMAHELSHVSNRDVLVMTIASFIATIAGLMTRMALFSGMARSNNNGAAVFAIVMLVSILVYVIGFVLIRTLSRYREYAADRGAAIMTGNPSGLAAALMKISGKMERVPQRDLREAEPMNAFFIMPAHAKRSLMEIFSTHPPIEKRIDRLRQIEAEMQGVTS